MSANSVSHAPVSRRRLLAFVLPMLVFVSLLGLKSALGLRHGSFWITSSEYWIYPAQTLICGWLVLSFSRNYDALALRQLWFAIAIGIFVFALWISPQTFFGAAPRTDGFNPDLFTSPVGYWFTVVFRFLRLVVVVPFVEEIFWRGFLLRYLIAEDFTAVAFGKFSWLSFIVVALAFGLSHSPADFAVAILTGALYNLVAIRTKSLGACIVAHALTNLLLGLWIMHTKQWGFW